jgi:hypothetical protein
MINGRHRPRASIYSVYAMTSAYDQLLQFHLIWNVVIDTV